MKIFKNKKASRDYFFVNEYEAGIVLKGTEIKAIRAGKINFKDSYAHLENGEVWLYNLHISSYRKGSYFNHDPERKRKLLLNKREIRKLKKKVEERGFTLIPKDLYINEKNKAKITLCVAKGKKKFDKREDIKRKDEQRDTKRSLKNLI